jgi:hypothetical protein
VDTDNSRTVIFVLANRTKPLFYIQTSLRIALQALLLCEYNTKPPEISTKEAGGNLVNILKSEN